MTKDSGRDRSNRRTAAGEAAAVHGGRETPALVAEASEPGSSISLVARRNGISSSLVFCWRRLMEQGELESPGADEQVVSLSEATVVRLSMRA
jgi:transposase